MSIYQKFKNSCLDLTILGLQDQPSFTPNRLPDNARILSWLVGSSVCFCQLPDHGDTVFAADADALPSEQLIPVAEDIPHFIGLLVCCPDAALIAGAYQWSSKRFQQRITAITLSMKAQSVIRALTNTYHPPVIENPISMMAQLRTVFSDRSQLGQWKVTFDRDFAQDCADARCGKELVLNRKAAADRSTWHVPSVYLCEDGIVVDVFMEVSDERLANYQNVWQHRKDETLSLADKLQRQLDDPMTAAVTGVLTVNEKVLRCKRSFTAIWDPMSDNSARERSILRHYGLDLDQSYLFRRYCFARKGKQSQVRSMQLTLEATPAMVPDRSFTVTEDGMQFTFKHPATGLEHCFTALSLVPEALNPNFLTNHPCFYTRLNYALEPSISPENFTVVDCDPGDPWEGYQDDPAAVIFANRKPDRGRYALSSLHYEPREHVCWRMLFRRKLHPDISLKLLPQE